MKMLLISLLPLFLLGCGTVVGNGKSGEDKPKRFESGKAVDNSTPVSEVDSASPGALPTPLPPKAESANILARYFFVGCASPFAISDEAGFTGAEGALSVTVDDDIRYVVGAMMATVTPDVSADAPYAIEAISGLSPTVTCSSLVSDTVAQGTRITVTFSDTVKLQWVEDAGKLQSMKVTSGDSSQSIEYTRGSD